MRLLTLLIIYAAQVVFLSAYAQAESPGDVVDLKFWKLTLPTDQDRDGKVDEVSVRELKKYSHPDYFYVDENGLVVFTAPNKAATTTNSTNTRSELRQMFRSTNTSIGTHDLKNNFSLSAHPQARQHADIGGQLEATLKVQHVARRAKYPGKRSAFSVVVGQIHALKSGGTNASGYGNEPLKIFYKKWPGHNKGSVFWAYERNLAKEDPDRRDIAFPVWGNSWDDLGDPGEEGIALGEMFNYNVNVYGNIMHLTFRTADPSRTKSFQVDLSRNIDEKDNPKGYSGDSFYFKAGAYNQCSSSDTGGLSYPACLGAGDWETDRKNGDYASVAFRRISLTRGVNPEKRE